MKTFLFIFLAGYAVRCDDSNYYVVQMLDNDVLPTKDFNVYWNVPTIQCKSKKIYFEDLYAKYGILQNAGDTFRGDKIAILYDPGDFPALLRNSSSGEIKYRNGGVPQEGDLIMHLDTFQKVLEQSVPDTNFSGIGIIDFESWKPVLRQNFGILTPYKDVSYAIEKKRHWWWPKQWIEQEAKRRFEEAGREFMQATVVLAKKMRPRAMWGYYGFPHCFNMAYNNRNESCAAVVPQENDGISWLWQESTALYPSVYSSGDITPNQLASLIRGRVKEAARVAKQGAPILPYFWYRYRDKGYFNESDLDVAISTFYKSNASGFIIWGSSNDVNTIEKCQILKKYVTDTLGPAIAKYTKRSMLSKLGGDFDETYNVVFNPNNALKDDPEYTWIPPVNYTQKIEEMVDKELKEEKEAAHKDIKESILVDMILHKILNYCAEGCDNKSKVRRTDENEGDGGINEPRVVLVTEDPFKKNFNGIEVTVPTTTEEDIYDYDTDTTGDVTAGDIYETNEYIVVSTTGKSNYQISTTIKSIEEVSTTAAEADAISIVDISKEENGIFNINKEKSSSVNVSYEESSTIPIGTTEADESRLIIEELNAVDLSTEETNSTEESTTEISTTTSRPTEPSIKEITTTESTTNYSPEGTIIIKNDLSLEEDGGIDENNPEYNSIEVDFIDISTEESSTINPTIVDSTKVGKYSTAVEPSTVDDDAEVSINSATVKLTAVDNGTAVGSKNTTVETNAVDNGTTVGSKTATVETNAVDNGTTVGSKTATVEPSAVDNYSTTVGRESASFETNAVDNDTRAVANIDSSTTLAPVLIEQVVVSVV